jgi:hypothetical protein
LLRSLRENGLRYTLRRVLEKCGLKFGGQHAVQHAVLSLEQRLSRLHIELLSAQYNAALGLPSLPPISRERGQFIVTLTSYGCRIASTAPKAIWSLFNQSLLPDRIILWLAHADAGNIPPQLQKFQEHGLEIRFCDDLKSYTKLIPALQAFPEDILITADDDCYYPRDWFVRLRTAWQSDPAKIWCHRAHVITFDKQGGILPYEKWEGRAGGPDTPQGLIFPTGVGGVLYPPHSLHPIVSDAKEFMTLSPKADDVWFWAMAKLKGTGFGVLRNGYMSRGGECYDIQVEGEEQPLWMTNVGEKANDAQIAAVLARFPEVMGALGNVAVITYQKS